MKREAVIKAISHTDPGCVPFFIQFTGDAFQKYGDALYEKYVTAELAAAHRDRKISRDNAIYLGMGNFVLAQHAPWWRWANKPNEYHTDPTVPSYIPETSGSRNYEDFYRELRFVRENLDAYTLSFIYGSHFEKANDARGIENFLADMAGEPEYATELLATIIRKNIVMLENITSARNLDGILLGSDWGSQRGLLMSPNLWREMIAQGELAEYRIIKAGHKNLWIHSCGDIVSILPDLVEMGVEVINPVQPECMDIYDLKKRFGNSLTFWGGIGTQKVLPFGTPEEVAVEVGYVIEHMSENGGYITSPSQEIQTDVPFENICALIDTARRYAGIGEK
jgi:uroporphyrinogen decarboxylase